jgi:hypothetical protein
LLTVTFTDSPHSFTQPHQQPAAVKKNFFAGVRYQQQRTTPGYCKVSTEQSNSPPLLVSRAKSRARTEAVKATGFAHPLGFPPQNGKTLAKKKQPRSVPNYCHGPPHGAAEQSPPPRTAPTNSSNPSPPRTAETPTSTHKPEHTTSNGWRRRSHLQAGSAPPAGAGASGFSNPGGLSYSPRSTLLSPR